MPVPDPTGPEEPGDLPGEGTTCGYYEGTCEGGSCTGIFACTEAGIREAIAAGAGPHTFDCDGPTTVVTEAEIVIDSDVILDGAGNLTVDGNRTHRVFSVPEGATAELRGLTITRGALHPNPEANVGGIDNLGTLTMVNSTVSGNVGAGIANGGTLTATGSSVADNPGGGIDNGGALTLNSSSVDVVSGISGPITITNSTLWKVHAPDGLTLTSSTVVGEGIVLGSGSEVLLTGNIVSGPCLCGAFPPIDCADVVTSNGYNIESPGDTCGFDDPTDQASVSAEALALGPLQDNGGPTMTHALLIEPTASVAIDAIPADDCVDAEGELLQDDQRGEPRFVFPSFGVAEPVGDGCDVGAFEVQP